MEEATRVFAVFDCTPFLASLTTLEEGRYLLVNRAFSEFTGYSPEEALGRTSTELGLAHPGGRGVLLDRILSEGQLRDAELRFRAKDGRPLWCLFNAHPVEVGGAKVLLTTALDITARKEAEVEAELHRSLLQQLSGRLPGLLYQSAVEEDGTVRSTYVSPESRALLGLPPDVEGFFGRYMACVHEEDREGLAAKVRASVEGEAPFEARFRFVRPDGEVRWIESHALPRREGRRLLFNGIQVDVTERVRTEEALAESRRQLEDIAANLPGMFYQSRADADGSVHLTYLSPGAKDFNGLDEAPEGYFDRFVERVREEDRAPFLGAIREALEREAPLKFQLRYVRPDGREIWIANHSVPFRRGDGLYYNGIGLDVTEQRRAQDALREAEERYRLLVETTGTGFVIIDDGGRVLDANDEYVRLTGRSRLEEILGRPVTDWTAPHDLERNAAEVRRCVESGSVRGLEIDYVSPSGAVTPIEINASVLRGEGGGGRILTLCRDISGRRRAEEALRASEERFSRFLGAMPAGAFLAPPGGAPLLLNPYLVELMGWQGWEDWRGKGLREIFPEPLAAAMEAENRRVLDEGPRTTTERIPDRHGVERIFRSCKFPVRGADGSTLIGGVSLDVTDQVQAAEALRESEGRFQLFLDHLPAAAFLKDEEGRVVLGNRYSKEVVWGRDVTGRRAEEFFPEAAEKIRADDLRVLRGETFRLEETLPDPRGLPRRFETIRFPVPSSRGVFLGGIALDATDRVRAEEALRESEERFHLFLDHLPAAALIKDGEGRVLLANRYVKERVWGRDLTGRFTQELRPEEAEQVTQDDRRALAGEVQRLEETVADASGEARRFQTIKFPIPTSRGTLLGGVAVDVTERRRAEEALRQSEERLRDLAAYQRDAVEAERSRIAREIHDELAQRLTALNMDLHWLRRRLSPEVAAAVGGKVEEMMGGVEATRMAVVNLIREMRPPILDDLGLVPALEWMCGDVEARSGLAISLSTGLEEMSVPGPVGTAAYRIVQEALTNAVRHSGAAEVRVALELGEGALLLSVQDDGRGIDTADAAGVSGRGILGMRERVRALGGSLEISGSPGKGTRLAASLPLRDPEAAGPPPGPSPP